MHGATVSVFIPVYNGEKYLRECIDAVLRQKLPKDYELELLITDSGSKDGSVEIVRSYGDKIVFDEIPNSDYGHGKTRQRAAMRAKGDFVLFLSQDATPSSDMWLVHMIEPFFVSDKVSCVFGRQVPRPFSVPIIKRDIAQVFSQFGLADQIVIHRSGLLIDTSNTHTGNGFFSDVNSAIRKSALKEVPFQDIRYAEDQALAKDMLAAGYWKAYAPQGAVWHSNEYTVSEYRKRIFDEYCGLQESISYPARPSLRSLLLGWIKPTAADWRFIFNDREYTPYVKLKYSVLTVGYEIMKQRGIYDAARFSGDQKKRASLSLEEQRK